jgi:hypothetical protein
MDEMEMFTPEEMQSPLEAIKETDAEGHEWWNSRKLAQLDSMFDTNKVDNSYEAIEFRKWTREVLKEYIIKGFAIDDERLKGNQIFGNEYFEDLQERVIEIRLSERSNCQKMTDIYAEFSCDYSCEADTTKSFYITMMTIMHQAALLDTLTRAFLDIAERRAKRHLITTMADWKQVLEQYFKEADADILPDAGSVTHEEAEAKALEEYEKFRRIQDNTLGLR